jgi:hypothetical protein
MYIIFVPVFTILAFLVGSALAFIAMANTRQDPTSDDSSEGEPAH